VSEGSARPKIPTKSWLIRCWEEPREQDTPGGPDPIHRCSVRDLETGEERYVSDPREVGDLVTRRMRETEG
jgi:hypothetical protein